MTAEDPAKNSSAGFQFAPYFYIYIYISAIRSSATHLTRKKKLINMYSLYNLNTL